MNCKIGAGTGRQLLSSLQCVVLRLPIRHTSKIGVEVDTKLLHKLEANEVKPRQHPGVVKADHLDLPAHISRALQRVIGDHPVKTLVEDCKQLNQYLTSRHPPLERDEMAQKMQQIYEELDRRMPVEHLEELSEGQVMAWRTKREQLKQRLMGNKIYAWKPVNYGAYEGIVYAIGRGAQEYSILARILREIAARDPSFKPYSYFDFGSGVGTGMWAASTVWKESIFEYFNVDSSRDMNEISDLILREGNANQQTMLRNVFYRQFLPGVDTKYDLVISSFSLFELPSAQQRKEVMLSLWRKCSGYMIIVTEGTRRGTELVNEIRDYILGLQQDDLKGHIFAPCPHNLTCPRLESTEDRTPCNFEITYTPFKLGNIQGNHSKALYSYCVLKKGNVLDETQTWPRLVRPTLTRTKHVICRMCTADAKLQEIIFTQAKHGRPAYRCAKASRWGDRLPITVGDTYETHTRQKLRLLAEKKNSSP